MHLAKNLEIPLVLFAFIVVLLALYVLICGVECCQECRHLRLLKEGQQRYERVRDTQNTAMNV